MKKMMGLLALGLVAGATMSASAQNVVAPNANAGASGTNGLNTLIRNAANPRTYQLRVPTSQLNAIPEGSLIDAITFRFDQTGANPATWPPAGGATWVNYDITLSEDATNGGVLSTTFASNQLNPVEVRSGALTIPAGSFTSGSSPNDWGFQIVFDEAYEYSGGPLIITITHTGSNQVPAAPFLDTVADAGNSLTASTYQAAAGVVTSQTIVRLRTADEGTFVAPNNYTHAEVPSPGQANSFFQVGNRTVQVQYASGQLGGLAVGEIITGIWMRSDDFNGPGTWPPAGGATFSAYDISLSQAANTVATLSTSFSANQVNPVLVRSGPLTIPAGVYTSPAANQIGNFVEIPVKPYVYQGGSLVVTITHTGQNSGSVYFVDGENSGSAVCGYVFASNYQASTGAVNSGSTAPVMRFTTRTAFGTLWNNGTVVNQPNQGAGGNDLSLVTNPDSSGGFTASSGGNFRVADEVHILEPQGWNVTRIALNPYSTGDIIGSPSIISAATVRIWDGVPEAFGSMLVAQSSAIINNVWTGTYRAFDYTPLATNRPVRDIILSMPANTVLPRGTYYVDMVFTSTGIGPFVPPVQTFRGGMSGDGLQRSAPGVWGPATDTGSNRQMELPFRVIGSVRVCRPDLTTGAIPGGPGYGNPNGTLNNDDFFYYLSQFAAGNLAVADLTAGAIPGQLGYGVPNGIINNDDFFFYLSIFATGC